MKTMLCIVGPTGTGKTNLAVAVSQKFPSVLISADSRQVYRGMDIVTGKDHPDEFDLYGIDLVEPDQECSVSVWYDTVSPALSLGKLPVVVGGTGLYVKALTDGIATMGVKPDPKLRAELTSLTVEDLQSRLAEVNRVKLESMNHSDAHNPRRLIRAIEISLASPKESISQPVSESVIVGLLPPEGDAYRNKVELRVRERLAAGAIDETTKLLSRFSPDHPAMTAIGYRSVIRYINNEIKFDQMVETWTADEMRYAKRQLTWFKKIPGIVWLEAADSELADRVVSLIKL